MIMSMYHYARTESTSDSILERVRIFSDKFCGIRRIFERIL
jgi:hypothetical protein